MAQSENEHGERAPGARKRGDHIVYGPQPNTGTCRHCGETFSMSVPVRVEDFLAANENFVKSHSDCVNRANGVS